MVLKPAYKMKKSEILVELDELYGCKVDGKRLKRELVYLLQSCRMNSECVSCVCEKKNDLQDINVADKKWYQEFWAMFKFWN